MAFIKIVTRNVKFNSFLILNSAKIKNKMALKIVTLQRNTLILISSCRVDGKDPAFFFVFEARTSKTICWFKELK